MCADPGASECRANTKACACPGSGKGLASPEAIASEAAPPLVVDLMCGPNAPISKVDWVLDPSHDLSAPACQELVKSFVAEAVLVAGALDCSTKSRAREIHRGLPSGRQLPKPLRSEQHPMGVPGLGIEDQRRVSKDNVDCDFILDQMQTVVDRGGGALRENRACIGTSHERWRWSSQASGPTPSTMLVA